MLHYLLENHLPFIEYLSPFDLNSLECIGGRTPAIPKAAWRTALVRSLQLCDTRPCPHSITLIHDETHVTSCDRQLAPGTDGDLYRHMCLTMCARR